MNACRARAVGKRLSSGHHVKQASAHSHGRISARQNLNLYHESPGEQKVLNLLLPGVKVNGRSQEQGQGSRAGSGVKGRGQGSSTGVKHRGQGQARGSRARNQKQGVKSRGQAQGSRAAVKSRGHRQGSRAGAGQWLRAEVSDRRQGQGRCQRAGQVSRAGLVASLIASVLCGPHDPAQDRKKKKHSLPAFYYPRGTCDKFQAPLVAVYSSQVALQIGGLQAQYWNASWLHDARTYSHIVLYSDTKVYLHNMAHNALKHVVRP